MFFNDRHRAGSFPLRQPKSRSTSNYKLLQNQLDKETAALLNERKNLQIHNSLNSGQTIPSNYNSRKVYEKGPKSRVSENIEDIVKMCEDDKKQLGSQFEQMSRAEHNIFELLKDEKEEKLQLQNYEVRPHKNSRKYEKRTKSPLKSKRQKQGERDEVSETFQNIKQKLGRQSGFSDDIFLMIEAIQRKALLQIDALKKDKSELTKQLNEQRSERLKLQAKLKQMQSKKRQKQTADGDERREIQALMEEYNPQILKNKILELYDENQKYKNYFFNQQSVTRDEPQSDYLRSQIYNLQQKLHEYQIEINQLKNSQSSHLEFDLLLEQGEQLRKETLHLLRKQGLLNTQVEKIIKNLEERLEEEEIAKNAFLHDLEKFKENYLELEEQNRRLRQRTSEETTDYQWKSHHTRATKNEKRRRSPKRRLELYENLIGEIKRVAT